MNAATSISHAHVTAGAVLAAFGVLGVVVGVVRRVILVAIIAVVALVVGAVVVGSALSGTHCAPGSQQRVCLTVRR